jgi:adenosylhomocysteine nucleosidase
MLCIIAAMEEEVELLINAVRIKSVKKMPCDRRVYLAEYAVLDASKQPVGAAKDFIIAVSGIGKVNSAVMLQYVIDNYKPGEVINIGTAGGMSGVLNKNDIMIAKAAFQHDYDLGPVGGEGYVRGDIPNVEKKLHLFDADMIEKLKEICIKSGSVMREGIVVSGDMFISDSQKIGELKEAFSAIACEMEAAALVQTAALNGFKKIAAVKSISDNADENAAEDFGDIAPSKEKIRDIILEYLKR